MNIAHILFIVSYFLYASTPFFFHLSSSMEIIAYVTLKPTLLTELKNFFIFITWVEYKGRGYKRGGKIKITHRKCVLKRRRNPNVVICSSWFIFFKSGHFSTSSISSILWQNIYQEISFIKIIYFFFTFWTAAVCNIDNSSLYMYNNSKNISYKAEKYLLFSVCIITYRIWFFLLA